ncbi:hypothetical protein [Leifsonia sp. SIMBA_070]|uniref:hypothetical protein n=1 Tax=Leifsonia sp. SIMBA_070 TaxID=3085810 RepID=UPI00397AEFDC
MFVLAALRTRTGAHCPVLQKEGRVAMIDGLPAAVLLGVPVNTAFRAPAAA